MVLKWLRRARRSPGAYPSIYWLVFALLKTFSWQELLHHPWRTGAAVLAVLLGVALAFSVALINASALNEFAQAVRSVNGEPDLELRALTGTLDENWYPRLAQDARVAVVSPVLEVSTYARVGEGRRVALRVVGVDALEVARVAPGLMPRITAPADRMALFSPATVFLNASARAALAPQPGGRIDALQLQMALQWTTAQVAGDVGASGAPLAVMDIGAMQDFFGRSGQLTRIDLRLRAGSDAAALQRDLQADPLWRANLLVAAPSDGLQRIGNVSRAYRVNLTVLALVALFTGAFLVFSVLALSVARRAQQFALLGVLGLSGDERLRLVLVESLMLGTVGSAGGLALGTLLAWLALRLLGGDLGGGYFPGVVPTLQWSAATAALYGALGIVAALAGGWFPARAARHLPVAQTLKGLDSGTGKPGRWHLATVLLLGAMLLSLAPPIAGVSVAAYVAIGLLLVGGISALPWLTSWMLDSLAAPAARWLLPMLAIERARRVRASAAVAISGVVAALSLAVALTVMVASFRSSVDDWLAVVLPADLYLRTASGSGASDTAYLPPEFVQAVARIDGIARAAAARTTMVSLDPAQASVALLSRALGDPARSLPLLEAPLPVPAGAVAIYVSEPMVALYGARPGQAFAPLAAAMQGFTATPSGSARDIHFFVAGVWRDYARQFGAIAMDKADFERLTNDRRANDLALTLTPGADSEAVQQAIRQLADQAKLGSLLEIASASEIRKLSLRIFDRSFAVTYWLQAVAIAIGLFGVAASFSAQVLARRKEFGLLAHIGLTRRQILRLVAAEGLAWTSLGALAGLALGLAVSVILVHVVNPQSFHWTMDLRIPWLRLLALCAATVLAGTCTAWLAARAAAGRDAVLAVKEDW